MLGDLRTSMLEDFTTYMAVPAPDRVLIGVTVAKGEGAASPPDATAWSAFVATLPANIRAIAPADGPGNQMASMFSALLSAKRLADATVLKRFQVPPDEVAPFGAPPPGFSLEVFLERIKCMFRENKKLKAEASKFAVEPERTQPTKDGVAQLLRIWATILPERAALFQAVNTWARESGDAGEIAYADILKVLAGRWSKKCPSAGAPEAPRRAPLPSRQAVVTDELGGAFVASDNTIADLADEVYGNLFRLSEGASEEDEKAAVNSAITTNDGSFFRAATYLTITQLVDEDSQRIANRRPGVPNITEIMTMLHFGGKTDGHWKAAIFLPYPYYFDQRNAPTDEVGELQPYGNAQPVRGGFASPYACELVGYDPEYKTFCVELSAAYVGTSAPGEISGPQRGPTRISVNLDRNAVDSAMVPSGALWLSYEASPSKPTYMAWARVALQSPVIMFLEDPGPGFETGHPVPMDALLIAAHAIYGFSQPEPVVLVNEPDEHDLELFDEINTSWEQYTKAFNDNSGDRSLKNVYEVAWTFGLRELLRLNQFEAVGYFLAADLIPDSAFFDGIAKPSRPDSLEGDDDAWYRLRDALSVCFRAAAPGTAAPMPCTLRDGVEAPLPFLNVSAMESLAGHGELEVAGEAFFLQREKIEKLLKQIAPSREQRWVAMQAACTEFPGIGDDGDGDDSDGDDSDWRKKASDYDSDDQEVVVAMRQSVPDEQLREQNIEKVEQQEAAAEDAVIEAEERDEEPAGGEDGMSEETASGSSDSDDSSDDEGDPGQKRARVADLGAFGGPLGDAWAHRVSLYKARKPRGKDIFAGLLWMQAWLEANMRDYASRTDTVDRETAYLQQSVDGAVAAFAAVALLEDAMDDFADLRVRYDDIMQVADNPALSWTGRHIVTDGIHVPSWSGSVREVASLLLVRIKQSLSGFEGVGSVLASEELADLMNLAQANPHKTNGRRARNAAQRVVVAQAVERQKVYQKRKRHVKAREAQGTGGGAEVQAAADAQLDVVAEVTTFPFQRTGEGGKTLRMWQKLNVMRFTRAVNHGHGLIIADEPGLGKTLSAIACACSLSASSVPDPASFSFLVVCPAGNVDNPWVDDLKDSTTLEEGHICRYGSKNRDVLVEDLSQSRSVVYIASYDMVRLAMSDGKKTEEREALLKHRFDAIVLDEMHSRLLNEKSQTSVAFAELIEAQALLSAAAGKRFGVLGLTGTPVVNSYGDIARLCAVVRAPPLYRATKFWSAAEFKALPRLPVLLLSDGTRQEDIVRCITRTTTATLNSVDPGRLTPLYVFEETVKSSPDEEARFIAVLMKMFGQDVESTQTDADVIELLMPARMSTSAIPLSYAKSEAFEKFNGKPYADPDTLRAIEGYHDVSKDTKAGRQERDRLSSAFDEYRTKATLDLIATGAVPEKYKRIREIAMEMHADNYKVNEPCSWSGERAARFRKAADPPDGRAGLYTDSNSHSRKVIIFSESNMVLKTLQACFPGGEYTMPEIYNGATSSDMSSIGGRRVNNIVHRFQTDPQRWFLLINTRAGSVGLNIQEASGIIFATVGWTAVEHQQALARAWRMRQTRDVRVAFLLPRISSHLGGADLRPTLESEMYGVIEKKRKSAIELYGYIFPTFERGDLAPERPPTAIDVGGVIDKMRLMDEIRSQYKELLPEEKQVALEKRVAVFEARVTRSRAKELEVAGVAASG